MGEVGVSEAFCGETSGRLGGFRPQVSAHKIPFPGAMVESGLRQGAFKVTTLLESGKAVALRRYTMPVRSAGILLHRLRGQGLEVFLVHPGGPFWKNKDVGVWSIPKGLIGCQENALAAARREFREETGFELDGDFRFLGTFRQPGGKQVIAYALEGDCNPSDLVSNSFAIEWPPRSGKFREFPEADRGAWFARAEAETKILKGQKPILDSL
jgi:predicted NUDIX family NTP pyrophosphohydrolase